MAEQIEPEVTKPPSRAQNIFALGLTFVFLAVAVFGGWYLRSQNDGRGGAGAQTPMGQGTGNSAAQSPLQIGKVPAQVNGEFRMPQSNVVIEFKDAQGKLVDVGQVKLALDMNMPGMVMHDNADITGNGGRYIAKVKPKMVGDWTASLSYNGPQGSGEKSFQVSVK